MEDVSLENKQSRVNYFQQGVLDNLQYWQAYLESKVANMAILNRQRNIIVRAISFALNLDEAWSAVYQLIITFSPYMERWGYWEAWGRVLDLAIKTGQRVGDLSKSANLAVTLALMFQRQSRFGESIRHYRQAIRLARHSGHQFALARAYTNLAYLYTEQGYWWRAEVLCCRALKLFERIDSDYGRAHTENHLGILYSRQGVWDQAQQHLERACTIWRSSGDHHGLLRGFINFSLLYLKLEQPNRALNYLKQALHQAQLTGDETEIGPIYVNMAIAYKLRGELVEAETYDRLAETIFQQNTNLTELARVWGNLGLVYILQRRWHEAMYHLEKSLETWRKLGSRRGEIVTLLNFVEYELARGNYQQALTRLIEVEEQIEQTVGHAQRYHYHTQLDQYRRSLSNIYAQAAAD